jgi:hypothetical protein
LPDGLFFEQPAGYRYMNWDRRLRLSHRSQSSFRLMNVLYLSLELGLRYLEPNTHHESIK